VIGRAAGTTSSIALSGVRTTLGLSSSGNQRVIGSSRATRLSSTSSITAAAVIGFVIEAIRTIDSVSSSPALQISTSPLRATSAAAPGAVPSSTAPSSRSWSSAMANTYPTGK